VNINKEILQNYIRHRNVGEVEIDDMMKIEEDLSPIKVYLIRIAAVGTMIGLCVYMTTHAMQLGISLSMYEKLNMVATVLLVIVSYYFVATIYRTTRMYSHWAFYQVMAIRRSYKDDSKTFSEIFGKKPAEYQDVSVMSQDVEQIITDRMLDVLVFKRRKIRNGELRALDIVNEAFDTAICFCPINGYNFLFARAEAELEFRHKNQLKKD